MAINSKSMHERDGGKAFFKGISRSGAANAGDSRGGKTDYSSIVDRDNYSEKIFRGGNRGKATKTGRAK